MGIGVLDMVEMYASSVCDTQQTLLPKDPVEPTSSSCRGVKRRMSSAASEDSGRPRSPRTPRSPKSPRSLRSDNFTSSLVSSPDRSNSSSSSSSSSLRYPYTPAPYLTTDTEDEEIVKRARLEDTASTSSTSSLNSSAKIRESYESRRKRFLRTAEALRHSGLLDITMKTAELLRKNQGLQKEIENLQRETRAFVLSVLTNPENRPILDNIRSQAQLYEVVVPGSQGIMSVTSSASLPEHNFHCGNSVSSSEDDDSLASNDNVSSPSPAPTESDGASSMSEDSDSSEKENLSPPPRLTSRRSNLSFKQ